ncbi:nucleotide exchange factor GrpE [Roseobacteraceae bacterium S113]
MAEPKEDPFLDDIDAAEADDITLEEIDDAALEVETLRAERDDMKDKWMRALADAENARKRSAKDRQDSERYGGTRIARDLLPVYDNLHRALGAAEEGDNQPSEALLEGVQLTLRELMNIFEKHGVQTIIPEVGDKFDPEQHEAMFEAPVPGTTKGAIIQVSAHGFMLYDRLLRPAQVGVSSNPG